MPLIIVGGSPGIAVPGGKAQASAFGALAVFNSLPFGGSLYGAVTAAVPTGFAEASGYGVPDVTSQASVGPLTLTPSSVSDAGAFGVVSASVPSGTSETQGFGAPTVTSQIRASGFAEVQVWSAVSIVTPAGGTQPDGPGNTGITVPTGVSRSGTVGNVAVVVPVGIAAILGSRGVSAAAPAGVAGATTEGSTAAVVPSGVTGPIIIGNSDVVVPGGVSETQGFGTPIVTSAIVVSGLAEAPGFGTPTVTLQIQAAGDAEASGFGTPSVASQAGQTTLSPSGTALVAAYGSEAAATPAGASAVGYFGGASAAVPGGVTEGVSYGSPTFTIQIQVTGYAQSTAFGQIAQIACPFGFAVSFSAGAETVSQEAGVVQAAGFGTPSLVLTIPGIAVSGLSVSPTFADPPIVVPTRFGVSCSPGVSPAVVSVAGVAQAAAYGSPTTVVGFRSPVPIGLQGVLSFAGPAVAVPSGFIRSFSYGSPTIGGIVVPFVPFQGAGRGRRRSETDLILEIWAQIEEKRRESAQISAQISDLRQSDRRKRPKRLRRPEIGPEIPPLAPKIAALQAELARAERNLAYAEEMARQNAVLRAIGDELRDLSASAARAKIRAHLEWLREDDEEAIMMLM